MHWLALKQILYTVSLNSVNRRGRLRFIMPKSTSEPEPNRGIQPESDPRSQSQDELADIVGVKEDRKVRARQDAHRSVWFGFGMFGLIGWSVSVPAVVCIALGVWIDNRFPSPYSWTLMLLFIGIILGCLNAWYWLSRERTKLDR